MKRIETVAILGVGLIGGSFALAIKRAGFKGTIIGNDSPDRLRAAAALGAVDAISTDISDAVRQADLIVLAAPVRANIQLLSIVAEYALSEALITDVGSTKAEISAKAGQLFGAESLRRFLPGHPIAGRELSGVEHADGGLFQDAPWVLTPQGGRQALIAPEFSRGLHREFIEMLESIGVRVIVTTPETHDRVLAFTSHLPQMVSTALSITVAKSVGDNRELRDLSGRALREMIRLSKSEPEIWAEIAASNFSNIREAIDLMEQSLAAIRGSMGSPELERLFRQGGAFDPDAEPSPLESTDPPRFD